MSDTDDTDLLLLIPPDFFLVQSSELDSLESDSEFNLGPDHDELKDFVVNDLITQVNDLESRVCMIENLETSITLCSTCNDDSLVNESVNSLTESDILRVQTQEIRETYPVETLICKRSFQSGHETKCDKLCNSFLLKKHLTDLDANKFDSNTPFKCTSEPFPKLNSVNGSFTHQSELLKEIDYFLATKDKTNPIPCTLTEGCKNSEVGLGKNHSLEGFDQQFSSQNVLTLDECLDNDSGDLCESLALPEVYSLLREMEETQYEIEKKLRFRDLVLQQTQDNKVPSDITARSSLKNEEFRSNMLNSKATNIEDRPIYLNSSKSLIPPFNNQNQILLDRVKNTSSQKHEKADFGRPRSELNSQASFLYSPVTSILSDDKLTPLQNESVKHNCLSPSRAGSDRNRIGLDVFKANSQKKNYIKGNVPELTDKNDSTRKSTSFRRHLLFEKPFISSKPRYSRDEQTLRSSNKLIQCDDASSITDSGHQTSIRSNALLDKRTLPPQNSTERLTEQQSLATVIEDKNSCESLQQKLSSSNLLSLSELWNKEPTFYSDDPNKLRQKLEEEKYRRQHCEQQIQALHLRILEEQEKLAVAIKVDQEKDKAILQITESWRKQNDHWSELEEQRHSLEKQLQDEKAFSKVNNEELTKKIERWEKEVSQALDLAAGYKEKSEAVQKEMELFKQNTEIELNELSIQLQQLTQDNEKIRNENKNLSKQLQEYEDRIVEEEDLLSKLKIELEKSKKQLLDFEAEVNALKEQKECLSSKLVDERKRSSTLDHQNSILQQALSEATTREKTAQEEARICSERIEVARTELRALYQGQLETVVKEKLQEFQSQLEAAEAALKAELHLKEKQWAEKANEQCRKLQEKLKVDKQRTEDSCREEINKWKVQLTESERLRSVVESRLQEETNRRADIAQRLHSVMETQWREALNIISNPMQNAYRVQKEVNSSKWPPSEQSTEKVKGGGDMRASRSDSTMSVAQLEEAPFFKEGLVTFRASHAPPDHQLKKYIQLLLERGPGNPLSQQDEAFQESLDQTFSADNSVLGNKWMQPQDENKRFMGEDQKMAQPSKPPWK